MHITAQFQDVLILTHRGSTETPLKQMTAPLMPTIEIDRIGCLQTMHKMAQIPLRCLQNEMGQRIWRQENLIDNGSGICLIALDKITENL